MWCEFQKLSRRSCARLALFIALLAAPPTFASAAKRPAPGDRFPTLDATLLEGKIPDLKSAHVVIVDFWASWCAPCKASFPMFDELHREFANKGVVILAVNEDQNVKAMESFLQRLKPGFTVVRDAKQKLVEAVDVPTMPTSFVLDGKGVVRFVHDGFYGDRSRKEYIEQINALLAESP
jgi:thiol-disulfide isomerase/thioredoxin